MRWMRSCCSGAPIGVGTEGKTTQSKLQRRLLPGRPEGARAMAIIALRRKLLSVGSGSLPLLASTDLRYPKEKPRLRWVLPRRAWATRDIYLDAIEELDLISPDLDGQAVLRRTLA
jgi:hypothetical protein